MRGTDSRHALADRRCERPVVTISLFIVIIIAKRYGGLMTKNRKRKSFGVRSSTCWQEITYVVYFAGGSVAEWLACWTQTRKGPGSNRLRRCRVTVLGKLFTPIVPLFTKQRNW